MVLADLEGAQTIASGIHGDAASICLFASLGETQHKRTATIGTLDVTLRARSEGTLSFANNLQWNQPQVHHRTLTKMPQQRDGPNL